MQIAADTSALVRNVEESTQVLNNLNEHAVATVAKGEVLGEMFTKVGELAFEGFTRAIEAIPELVEHTVDLGNRLFELSLKTGASVENLSALRYVAAASGTAFETFNAAFFKMEAALGQTGEKADKLDQSLSAVGLSMQALKNARPDEAFIQVVTALEHVENAADRNALAMQLFSRGAKEMAGLFQEDIQAMIQEARDLGLIMTTENAAAAHAASVGWSAFTMQLEAAGTSIGVTVLPALVAFESLASSAFTQLVKHYNEAAGTIGEGVLSTSIVTIGEALIHGVAAAAGFAAGATTGLEDVAAAAIRTGEAIVNIGAALIKVGTLGTVDEAGKTFLDKTQKALHDTYDALESLKRPLHDGADVARTAFAAIENAADGMAGKFGAALTAAQTKIDAFAKHSKAAGDTVASAIGIDPKTLADQIATTTRLWDEYYKVVNAANHNRVKAQIDDAYLAANSEIAAIEKTKAITLEDYDIIWAKADQTASNIIQKTLESNLYTQEHYRLLADEARAAYEFASAHAASYIDSEIQLLRQKWNEAERAAGHWVQSASDALAHATANTHAVTSATQAQTAAIDQQAQQVHTLSGEYITLAEQAKRAAQAFTFTYDLSTDAGIAKYRELNPAASVSWSNEQIEKFIHGGGTLAQLIAQHVINPYAGYTNMPSFDVGGPITSDGPIFAHAGEYVVPKGGALVGGGHGDINVSVSMQISGVFDPRTKDELTRAVTETLMRDARTSRLWPAP